MLKRIEWLDFSKGILIMSVVLVHSLEQMKAENVNMGIYTFLMAILFTFVMPCFFAISGYLYKKIDGYKNYLSFVYKKILGLGIPYIIISFIYVVLQQLSGKNNVHTLYTFSDLANIYKTPIGYLWFLYALLIMFIIKGILDVLKLNDSVQVVICIILFMLSIYCPNYFSAGISGAFSNIPYFFAGVIIRKRFSNLGNISNIKLSVIALLLVVSFAIQSMYVYGPAPATNSSNQFDIVTKIISIIFMFAICPKIKHSALFKHFDKYGKYSMIIYLVHVDVLAFLRVILHHVIIINNMNAPFVVIVFFVLTWLLSIVVCKVVDKVKILQFIFYPQKFLPKLTFK